MPPKRKQPEDSTTAEGTSGTRSTRSTRSSTTDKAKSTPAPAAPKKPSKTSTKKTAKNDNDDDESAEPALPPTKKPRTSGTKKAPPSRKGKASNNVDEVHPVQKPVFVSDTPSKHSQSNHVTESTESSTAAAPPAVPAKPPVPSNAKPAKNEPYTPARAEALFKQYADTDDPNVIGAEGFERLCNDASIALDGAQALILAWQFNTAEMMKITKDEWKKGTEQLKVSWPLHLSQAVEDLDGLLMEGKPSVKTAKETLYDRTQYQGYAADPSAAFLKLYMFCFNLVKPPQSKNIEMETSVAFWSVLLVPKYPIMSEVLDFIKESGTTYKATNKDLWSMMLEFCRTVSPNLTDYEADGAWPTLLDDFVVWKRSKSGGNAANGDGSAGNDN